MSIHPTAIVHPGAELADDVEVQPYTIIGEHVRIGSGSVIGPHCVITGRTIIGERNRIFSGAQIGVSSQDLKHKAGLIGRTLIGNDNTVREHATISASTMSSEADEDRVTRIRDGCLIMAYGHVAHDCTVGNGVIIANSSALSGHVEVEDKAFIGGLSGVHQFCRVGTMAMIGALTAVSKDAPPYMLVDGNPARCCGPNTVGLRRNGVEAAARTRIKVMYRVMWRSGLNTSQALEEIESVVEECEERTHFIEFVRRSSSGVT
jgi:UDP-N-acetylglucosamine acyltransferase